MLTLVPVEPPGAMPVLDKTHGDTNQLSPATKSISGSVGGVAFAPIALAKSTSGCTPSKTGLQCTLSVAASPGSNQTVVLNTYATAGGSGTPLGTATFTQTLFSGPNYASPVIAGIAQSIYVAPTVASIPLHQWRNVALYLYARDATGAMIPSVHVVGGNGQPIAGLAVSLAGLKNSSFAVASAQFGLVDSAFLYDGVRPGSETFTLSAPGYTSTSSTLKIGPPALGGLAPIVVQTNGTYEPVTMYGLHAGGDAAPISDTLVGYPIAESSGGDIWTNVYHYTPPNNYSVSLVEFSNHLQQLRTVNVTGLLGQYSSSYAFSPDLMEIAALQYGAGESGSIDVYSVSPAGTVSLTRTITTALAGNYGTVTIGRTGDVFVVRTPPSSASSSSLQILDYPPTGSGAVPPKRILLLPRGWIAGLGTDANGYLYVLDLLGSQNDADIYTFAPGASKATRVRISVDTYVNHTYFSVDAPGNSYVLSVLSSNYIGVSVFPRGKSTPSRTISGAKTGMLDNPIRMLVP